MLFPSMLANTVIHSANTTIKIVLFTLVTMTLIACTNIAKVPKADERLMGTRAGGFDQVLLLPGSGIAPFQKIYIEDAQVTFSKNWLKEFRTDYSERDLERITSSYSAMLKKALTSGMNERTVASVVNNPDEADIIFRPLLRELYIYGPDLSMPGRGTQYIFEAGNATFDLTLVNAQNNSVIAQFIDHRETSSHIGEQPERTNRATNARYFRLLMERWARNLSGYLTDMGSVSAK